MADGDRKIPPPCLWAQRKDKIYLTLAVQDINNETVKLEDKSLYFSAKGGSEGKQYEVTFEFFKEINAETSKHHKTGREFYFCLEKKEEGPFWPKLLNVSKKPNWLKTDFNRWRDEDDSDVDEEKDMAFEDMMSQMGNINTGGGEEEEEAESEDSDDEDLPDLE